MDDWQHISDPDIEPSGDERDEDTIAVDKALNFLASHFDCVTIFVNRFNAESGNTISAWRGRGNWHARHGQVREWVIKCDTDARIEASAANPLNRRDD